MRVICYGPLKGRLVVVGYTPRGADRPVFGMRKANLIRNEAQPMTVTATKAAAAPSVLCV